MWRGISFRALAFLFAGPLIMDVIYAMFVFQLTFKAEKVLKKAPEELAWIWVCAGVCYAVSAMVAGWWVKPSRTMVVMLTATAIITGFGLATLAVENYVGLLVLVSLMGIAMAHYFVPFQIDVGHVRPFRTLIWSVVFYNVSWGTGWATGSGLAGWLYARDNGVWLVVGVALTLVVAHAVIAVLAHNAPVRGQGADAPRADFPTTPRHRWVGWIGVAMSFALVMGMTGTLWPKLASHYGWTEDQKGLGVFLAFLPIPALAPLWGLAKNMLHGPWVLIACLIAIAGVYATVPHAESYTAVVACLVVLGVAHSCTIFHAVNYAIADPVNPARSVGINETVIGMTGVIGPLIIGTLAGQDALSTPPYIVGPLTPLAGVVAILVIWLRRPAKLATGSRPTFG